MDKAQNKIAHKELKDDLQMSSESEGEDSVSESGEE